MLRSRIQLILELLTPTVLIAFGIVLLLGVVPGPAGQTKLRVFIGVFAVLYGAGRLAMILRRVRRQEKQESKEDGDT